MPDITMCKNYACPDSGRCLRFNAPPNKYRQSYTIFPYIDGVGCEFYWEMDLQTDKPEQNDKHTTNDD